MDIHIGQIWEDYDFGMVSSELDALFPEYSFDLHSLLEKILEGDLWGAVKALLDGLSGGSFQHFAMMKDVFLWLLIVGITASVISHFVDLFQNRQVADFSFYFVYLLFVTIMLRCFLEAAEIAVKSVGDLVTFMKIFIPAYVISVGVTTGVTTATAYYGVLLAVIFFIQNLLLSVVVPGIYGYVMLSAINGVWPEEKLSAIVVFLEKGIRLFLKCSVGVVMGFSILQSLITPVIDSAKASALQKVISFIPGIGTAADGMADVMLGSALIIKNSIGVVMLILLVAICAVPVFEIGVVVAVMKLAAALLGIVSDKRIVSCADKIGNGSGLLLKTAGTAFVLFFLTVSVAAITTNRGF